MQINPVNHMYNTINRSLRQFDLVRYIVKHHLQQTRLTPQLINRIGIGFTGQGFANHRKKFTLRRMNFKTGLTEKSKLGLIEFNNAGVGKSGGSSPDCEIYRSAGRLVDGGSTVNEAQ